MWIVDQTLPLIEIDPILPVEYNRCEANVDLHVSVFGGEKIKGCYVLKHQTLDLYQLVSHYVWQQDQSLTDVTLFKDERSINNFLEIDFDLPNLFVQSLEKIDKYTSQEVELMYYIYMYLDPETDLPFYIGKGTQDRAYIHLQLCNQPKAKANKRFYNKLKSLKSKGLEPNIVFIGQNIIEEQSAYDLEKEAIQQYGRKGYDEGGILLNICEDARPPNHKGRTYQQIYGDSWQEQIEKRRQTQLSRGGFGPRKHSEETKRKISDSERGSKNHMFGKHHSVETRTKISQSKTGKIPATSSTYSLTHESGISLSLFGLLTVKNKCKELDISFSTLNNQIIKDWPRCKKGKTKGWYLERINSP